MMRKEHILITGNRRFTDTMTTRLANRTDVAVIPTELDLDTPRKLNGEIEQLTGKMQDSSIIFSASDTFLMPVLEKSIRQSKNVVIFGCHQHSTMELECLLDLSLEAGSQLLNGDALFFNPVVFSNIKYFEKAQISKLVSNRFNKFLSKRSIFSCVELLLWKIKHPVKKIDAKAVQLNPERLNLIHVRIEFENDTIAIIEMSNTKTNSMLEVESISTEAWLTLDLLTLNGTIHQLDQKPEGDLKIQSEKIYPSHRNPINNLLTYINEEIVFETNPHAQFENSIRASRVVGQIEEQLSRSMAGFNSFEL